MYTASHTWSICFVINYNAYNLFIGQDLKWLGCLTPEETPNRRTTFNIYLYSFSTSLLITDTKRNQTEPHIHVDVYYSALRVRMYFKHDGFRLYLLCYSERCRKLVIAYHPPLLKDLHTTVSLNK